MCICFAESASLGVASPLSLSFLGALGIWRAIAYSAHDFMPHTIREMDKTVCLGLITAFGFLAYESKKISITALIVLGILSWVHRGSCGETGEPPGPIAHALTVLVWVIGLLRVAGL